MNGLHCPVLHVLTLFLFLSNFGRERMGLGKILVKYVTSEYWRGVITSVNVPETDTPYCQACNLHECISVQRRPETARYNIDGASFHTCLYYSHRL